LTYEPIIPKLDTQNAKVKLAVNGTLMRGLELNGEEVLGVLGKPILCEGKRKITEWGDWHTYKQECKIIDKYSY
jgi:hypothetical protein